MVPLTNIFNAIFDLGQILKWLVYIETGHSEQSPDNFLNCPSGTVLIRLRNGRNYHLHQFDATVNTACILLRLAKKMLPFSIF